MPYRNRRFPSFATQYSNHAPSSMCSCIPRALQLPHTMPLAAQRVEKPSAQVKGLYSVVCTIRQKYPAVLGDAYSTRTGHFAGAGASAAEFHIYFQDLVGVHPMEVV